MSSTPARPMRCLSVLGTPLLLTTYRELIEECRRLVGLPRVTAFEFTNTQIVTKRRAEPGFRELTRSIDYFVPDGMPLIWCLNAQGAELADRVYGPAFMRECLQATPAPATHYLLGGSEELGRRLREVIRQWNPAIQVVGSYHGRCALDGMLLDGADDAVVEEINRLSPDYIWIGLGTPKQQAWVLRNKERLRRGVIFSVGFGFDVNAGTKADAPDWMQQWGLTWIFRVLSEPRRLAGRYARYNSLFLYYLMRDGLAGTPAFNREAPKAESSLRISVFGLGYVGAVTAACLARQGHQVVGVDVNAQKVEQFNQGIPPISEPGLNSLLATGRRENRLRATLDAAEAIADSEVSLVCVGTPADPQGAVDLSYVRNVVRQIAEVVHALGRRHTLVLRSTLLPGGTAGLVKEHLADLVETGMLEVIFYPEFLREGTAVADFDEPSLAVVGTRDGSLSAGELKPGLFGDRAVIVDWHTAELLKHACNAFHAAKVVFANEIGRLGKELRIDARQVMDLLCQDKKLNLSSCYLRPGNPFGGSCLPKDVRALVQLGRQLGVKLPSLDSLLPSNQRHLEAWIERIEAAGEPEVVILGLSFKAQTDDLRESAMVEVAQRLLERGHQLRIYDPVLNLASLVGSNKRAIEARIPRLASLLQTDLTTAVGQQGLIIVAQKCATYEELQRVVTSRHRVLDVNGWPELRSLPAKYEGLCW